jgi:regulator of sigma E protease
VILSILESVHGFGGYLLPFLAVLTALVFVHELGHYLIARRNGVRVEVFSIGFGPELFGWTDSAGTRWKFSLVPLGGYVKMFGDRGAASMPGDVSDLSPQERAVAFPSKRVGQRAAIVAAGPFANFLFAIIVFAGVYTTVGEPYTTPVLDAVEEGGAAARAGVQPGDRIVEINGRSIHRFEDIRRIVQIGLGAPLAVVVERGGERLPLEIKPDVVELKDRLGNAYPMGRLGVQSRSVDYVRHDPLTALWRGVASSWAQVEIAGTAISQMVAGTRGTEELGGPMRIAWISGEVAQSGIVAIITFTAILSVHLGLINLLPVPLLDGGHLLFYAAEAVRGRPLGARAQEYGFRLGLALILVLFVVATWNDLSFLGIIKKFQGLIS